MATRLFANDIARFFIGTVDHESGDNITHLKLQKLLYYAQGFHLALHEGEPLFPEDILAWDHGPVVREIWDQYNSYTWRAIDPPVGFDANDYPPEIRELLETVTCVYGQFSAKGLERKTHEEPPWKDSCRNEAISKVRLREFFSTLVQAGREGRPVGEEPLWPTNSLVFQQRRFLSNRMESNRARLRSVAQRFRGDHATKAE